MTRREITALEKVLETKLEEVYDLAHRVAVALVKEIMRKNKKLAVFYMSMGSYHFEDKHGNHIDLITSKMNSSYKYYYEDTKPSFKKFNDFMGKYCTDLGIYGRDVKITRNDL